MPGEKARLKLDKNTAWYFEQILEAAPSKIALYGHLLPISQTI